MNKKIFTEPDLEKQWEMMQKKGISIPKQPKVLLQVEKIAKSPDIQIRRLASQIKKDPGLSAEILYIVNSPAYGLSERINSIENAILILGADRTLNLCRAILLRESIDQPSPALEIFWKRSAFIADMTVAIANRQHIGISNDLAYLIGLFHACGVAILASQLPGYGDALAKEEVWSNLDNHSQKFSVDHVLVSYMVSRDWNLPEIVSEGILQQRKFTGFQSTQKEEGQDTNKQCAGLVSSLQLALIFYNRLVLDSHNSEWEAIQKICLSNLNMSQDEFSTFA